MLEKVGRVGRQAALAAGAVMRQNYLKPHQVRLKGVIDPVTETDYQAQEIALVIISRAFPEHGFLAEERRGEEGAASQAPPAGNEEQEAPPLAWEADPRPPRWIIDPLDGTVNFAHGFPMFCVSIALEAEGRLVYGVVYDPLRDELFEARTGEGARLNDHPIRVSRTERLEQALVATGFPYDIRKRIPETLARLGGMLASTQGVRRAGSAALDLCYLACGRFDGYYEENLKPWDTAAGLVIVSEAGGRLSTFDGGPYDIYSPNILASNGLLHDKLLARLQA